MKSVLNYFGRMSKSHVLPYLRKDIEIYVEPFSGSFNTAFTLSEDGFKGKLVFNDFDEKIYNFWVCVRDNPIKLISNIDNYYRYLIKNFTNMRKTLMDIDTSNFDTYEMAAYEYMMHLLTYYNGYSKMINGAIYDTKSFIKQSRILQKCELHNCDYEDIIQMYDSENTFFLLDPPFKIDKVTKYYRNVENFDHIRLKNVIQEIKGDWVLRYNINEESRNNYRQYNRFKAIPIKAYSKDITTEYFTNMSSIPEGSYLQ